MARTMTQPGPERTNRLLFIGAVFLAGLAALLIFAVLTNVGGDDGGGAAGGDTDVLVASRDIAAGTVVEEEMLEQASFSSATVIEGAVIDQATIVGKRIATPMLARQQFSTELLVDGNNELEDLQAVLDPGMVGFPLDTDESKVFGGLLVPGHHVDVLAVLPSTGEGVSNASRAVRIVQNARVISVGEESQVPGAETANDDEDAQPNAQTVTLEVNPGDDLLIALAQEEGEVYLSIRALGNDEISPEQDIVELPQ